MRQGEASGRWVPTLVRSAALAALSILFAAACSNFQPSPSNSASSGEPSSSINTISIQATGAPSQTGETPESQCAELQSVTPVAGAASATVIAAFETNESGYTRLQSRLMQGSGAGDVGGNLQAIPTSIAFAAQSVLICYFEGHFSDPHVNLSASPAEGSGPTRLVVRLGADNVVEPVAIGPDSNIPIVDPNQSLNSP